MPPRRPSIQDLPAPILVDILSRLPVKTIIHCKCVCKQWQILLSDSYFADLHLSRSPKGLMVHDLLEEHLSSTHRPGILKLVEVEDESDHHHLHHDHVMSLDLELGEIFRSSRLFLVGSVNGLLCLWQYNNRQDNTYICNPITREYMILPKQQYYRTSPAIIVYGFGFSSSTGEYKVVRIFQGNKPPDPPFSSSRPSLLETEVYTLGTGHWRGLGRSPYCLNGFYGPFLNGSVHWIVLDHDSPENICTFDFQEEKFQLFPSCPTDRGVLTIRFQSLGVLKGRLCQCDGVNSLTFVIWVMKEYGIKKSWHKELVIRPSIDTNPRLSYSLNVTEGLKDGTVLMVYEDKMLLAYCPDTKTVDDTKFLNRSFRAMTYVPSFLRLGNFESENVLVF